MGGLSKKAFQYEKISKKHTSASLRIDAGSLLFKHNKLSAKQAEQEKVTALGIVNSYNEMNYDAVGVARQDLIAGLDFLKDIATASTFPWLSANLVNKETGKPVFAASVIVSKGELDIGIIGLTSPQQFVKFTKEDNAEFIPWQETLADQVAKLSPSCDILILLSNLTVKENRTIAQQYKDINIMIQAGVNTANMPPKLTSNTLTCQTGKQGKQIGIMEINWQGTAWGSKKPEQLKNKKKTLDRLLWQLGKYKKYSNPVEDLQDNPNQLRAYQNLVSRKEKLEQEITKLTKEVSSDRSGLPPSTYKNSFMAMRTSLPDHKEILRIVEDLNGQISKIGKKQISRVSKQGSKYIGSSKCKSCHLEQFSKWQKSRHAHAYDTLVTKKQQFNLNCLPCHVTGSGEMDQGDAVNLPKELLAVGCENCHGPGKEHSSKPQSKELLSVPAAATCLKCHSDDHDDSFNYEIDVIKLQCR